jgi:GNAT superfamily N-acetyltransferase
MPAAAAGEEGEAAGQAKAEASRNCQHCVGCTLGRCIDHGLTIMVRRGTLAYDGGVLIRPAHFADLPRVMDLIRRVVPLMRASGNTQWDDGYPSEQIFAQDIEAGELWIAETGDGVLTGVAAFTSTPGHAYDAAGWDVDEPAVFSHRLAVDPDQRGSGVAVALMQQAEQVARERGVRTLRVDTGIENLPAQRLIERLSYQFVGEIPLAFRPGLRVRCYEKRLGGGLQVGTS